MDPCTRCGQSLAEGETADPHGWCAACRAGVVRTAGRAAYLPAGLVGLGWFWLMLHLGWTESRWVIGLLALGGLLVWLSFKVGRRVAFEALSARGRRQHARTRT
jgi:hypothetical protein